MQKVIPMFVQMSFSIEKKTEVEDMLNFYNKHKNKVVDSLVVIPRLEKIK